MFLAALIYLIILVVWAVMYPGWRGESRSGWISGAAQFVLFLIIGIVLFWNVLNKG